ncbi:hypothetical protein WICPIJ_005405 [Wickerhamomyces pijperi]|uniref:Initiation-specific alpha-1,6-mannosyltransferase n=1 Tax=Wickerhamomyces pijperi TaxID=599730 RepID=A0A9P8Q3K3_WICPI|nr:hypothetical protein WICPIJ_005405 [Wickerhamomyces pijperi]
MSDYIPLFKGWIARPPVQRLAPYKKAIFTAAILMTLAIITISTNQHEAIISALPTVTISRNKPAVTPDSTEEVQEQKHVGSKAMFPKFSLSEEQFQPVQTEIEIDGQIQTETKLQSPFTADTNAPKFSLSDSDIDRVLELPLMERLDLFFPYKTSTEPLDKNIIQKHTTSEWEKIGRDIQGFMTTWREPNLEQGFQHLIFDDSMALRSILKELSLVFPEIVETFYNFPKNILRYDFFRYIALMVYGGTYSDTDTRMLKPFSEWPVYQEQFLGFPNSIGAVIGIENECDCVTWPGVVARRIQFCQWTIQAKKHHPLMKFLINRIVHLMQNNYNVNTKVFSVRGKEYDFKEDPGKYYDGVMELTGPGVFTDSVFMYLNSLDTETFEMVNPNNMEEIYSKLRVPKPESLEYSKVYEPEKNPNVGWENFTSIIDPVVLNRDLAIAPRSWFNKNSEDVDRNLVQHMYYGSWKSSPVKRQELLAELE